MDEYLVCCSNVLYFVLVYLVFVLRSDQVSGPIMTQVNLELGEKVASFDQNLPSTDAPVATKLILRCYFSFKNMIQTKMVSQFFLRIILKRWQIKKLT